MSHGLASKGVPFSSILGLIVRRSIAKSGLIAFPQWLNTIMCSMTRMLTCTASQRLTDRLNGLKEAEREEWLQVVYTHANILDKQDTPKLGRLKHLCFVVISMFDLNAGQLQAIWLRLNIFLANQHFIFDDNFWALARDKGCFLGVKIVLPNCTNEEHFRVKMIFSQRKVFQSRASYIYFL